VKDRDVALELADQALHTGEGLAKQLRECQTDLDTLRAMR